MKSRIAGAAALAFALAQVSAMPAAYAETPQFRSAAPQAFSTQDLQRYDLSADATERAIALQEQGYEIRVLTHEEAEQYKAGITDNQWLMIGILAAVIVIAVAVSD